MTTTNQVRKRLGMPEDGAPLDAYAWPGRYPIFYQCRDGGVLCPKCVNEEIDLIAASIEDQDTR